MIESDDEDSYRIFEVVTEVDVSVVVDIDCMNTVTSGGDTKRNHNEGALYKDG